MHRKELAEGKAGMKAISCKEAVDFILKKEEGKLTLSQRVQLWRHLTICSLCRIFSSQSKLINKGLRHRHGTTHALGAEEKEMIIRNVIERTKE